MTFTSNEIMEKYNKAKRLQAAAPELLEALKDLVKNTSKEAYARARAAIAKAEGK